MVERTADDKYVIDGLIILNIPRFCVYSAHNYQ